MVRISGMSEKSMVSSPIVWRASISASCGERGLPRSSCSENCFSIEFSFVTGCAAGGNDSHDLLRALFSAGVNHGEKQQRALHRADGMPARFARFDPLRERQAIWVLKDEDGGSERNPGLADIGFVLLVVPFESHRFLLLQILASARHADRQIVNQPSIRNSITVGSLGVSSGPASPWTHEVQNDVLGSIEQTEPPFQRDELEFLRSGERPPDRSLKPFAS